MLTRPLPMRLFLAVLIVTLSSIAPSGATSWPKPSREPQPGCVAPVPQPRPSEPHRSGRRRPGCAAQTGTASWYGARRNGRPTANGETFDMAAMTAAHRTLPMNARVLVTRLSNGRSVVVRINDRGPFVHGRVIDVTPAAAHALGFSGLAQVSLDVIGRS